MQTVKHINKKYTNYFRKTQHSFNLLRFRSSYDRLLQQIIRKRKKIGVIEYEGGCGSVEFVGWCVMGLVIKAVNDCGATSGGLQVAMHHNCHQCRR